MDWTNLGISLLKGWLRITASVAVGIGIGCFLEFSELLQKLVKVLSPIAKSSRLPPICTSSFILSLASPRSANSLLASWYIDGRLSRRSLILGGISHTLPGASVHIRTMAFIIIPMLGSVGATYVLFQLLMNGLCSASVLLLSRIWREPSIFSASQNTRVIQKAPHRTSLRELPAIIKRRFARIYSRVMMISFPIYIVMAILVEYDVFHRLKSLLPLPLALILPAESLSIIAAHLGGILSAVTTAQPFLADGILNSHQVFTTLIIGYALGIPLRTVRHVLPSALGIYPGKTGLCIVAYTQSFKVLATLTVLIVLTLGATG